MPCQSLKENECLFLISFSCLYLHVPILIYNQIFFQALPGNLPGLDQVMYTKKKLMEKPSKKKTHFDKYDIKKAELKGSKAADSNADVVVDISSPSEKHFQKEQEKLAIASENEVSCWPFKTY